MAAVKTKRKIKVDRSYFAFLVMYLSAFIGMSVITALDNRDKIDPALSKSLMLAFLCLLYVTAFVQKTQVERKPLDIALNFFATVGSGIAVLLMLFFVVPFFFVAAIYSAVIICLLAARYAVQYLGGKDTKPCTAQAICAGSIILFVMTKLMDLEFVSEILWAWALIPAAALTFIAVFTVCFLLRDKLRDKLFPDKKTTATTICAFLCVLFIAFFYSGAALGAANYAFDDGKPTPAEYVVLDKKISSGARTPTQYEVIISIDGDKKWIDVGSHDYREIEKGDTVVIYYYRGGLGFGYWEYYDYVKAPADDNG